MEIRQAVIPHYLTTRTQESIEKYIKDYSPSLSPVKQVRRRSPSLSTNYKCYHTPILSEVTQTNLKMQSRSFRPRGVGTTFKIRKSSYSPTHDSDERRLPFRNSMELP